METKQQLIKELNEKKTVSIPKHMFVEWDDSVHRDHLELNNKIINYYASGLKKRKIQLVGYNNDYLHCDDIPKTFNFFQVLKKLLKRGMHMRLEGNELILFDSVKKVFVFNI